MFGRYQEFSCDECVSVKNTQILFRKVHKANLSDCFHLLTQREELCEGEEWFCSTCKGKKAGIKKLDFLDTPDVLVVHLKRFRQVNMILFWKILNIVIYNGNCRLGLFRITLVLNYLIFL